MEYNKEIYKVRMVETKSGIILNDKFQPYLGEGQFCLLFNDLKETKEYILHNLKPGIEYCVYNTLGEVVYEYVYDLVIRREDGTGFKKKKWWQFWK